MKKIYYLLFASLIMFACKKDKKEVAHSPYYLWSNYMGTYDVYDTISHTTWVMKMTHIYHSDYNNGNNDSIYLENFDNKFNIRFKWTAGISPSQKPAFGFGILHPIKDYSNYNWHLGCDWDDPNTTKEENVLQNDSMIIYFNISNIAFYQTDGVPYYACDCKHIAVKRK